MCDQRLQRAGITQVGVVVVIIGRAIVGPIGKVFQQGIGVLGGAFRTAKLVERLPPQVPVR